jgi:ATP-dependent exoDNAse (exonuclease V) beta subunit
VISRNSNILYDTRVKRSTRYDENAQQITLLDSRYYKQSSGLYYPSITYVLSYFPKGKFFESYLKDVGHNADIILRKAGEEGSQVHNAIENIIKGKPIDWLDQNYNAIYSLQVWSQIMRFADFWETYKPELVALEYYIHNDDLRYAGTIDLVCRINGKLWIIDFKTSNAIQETYFLQLASYKKAWDMLHPDDVIQETGILWLKAATRGPDKTEKKMQGDGWQVKQSLRSFEEDYKLFTYCYEFWKIDNPKGEPAINIYPTRIHIPVSNGGLH